MKYTFFNFISDVFHKQADVVTADLSGKTVLVVGANTGIGLETAIHFATMKPARIIMACRNVDKGNAAKTKVEIETLYKSAEVWLLDLNSYSSIVAFAEKVEQEDVRLDIVVANAAVAALRYGVSPEGWESNLQVNHLSTALLSLLLLPIMERTAKAHSTRPRLVFVSSGLHYFSSIPDDVVQSPKILEKLNDKDYSTSSPKIMKERYTLTKLLNLIFARALSKHVGTSSGVIVDIVSPGFCYSDLRRDPEYATLFVRVFEWLFAQSAELGSRNLIYAAVGGKDSELHGAYVAMSEIREIGDFALNAESNGIQKRLWDETIEILTKASSKLGSIVSEYLTV
ncbi:hypothetical protein PLICRDRAFT_33932 [Plicaturopsis crispa FD-325 SS-3]|nr:hypothetical protein PLICRDRAFT_33932 [Plicaturopsis crispa FD-325 SS-3]